MERSDNPLAFPMVDRFPEAVRTAPWVTNEKFDPVPVHFQNGTLSSLRTLVDGAQLAFYGPGEFDEAHEALVQVIQLDPRPVNRGRGVFL